MHCSYCGSTSNDKSKFCESCGKPIGPGIVNPGSQKSKILLRSKDDKMIAGVAAGVADYLGMDPTTVRIIWFLLIFVGGTGLLLYILMALIVPEE